MSMVVMGRVGLSFLLALVVLLLTSFFNASPSDVAALSGMVRFEVPAGGAWCGPGARLGTRSCGYSTFEQCLEAATGAYGGCRPNPAAAVITDDGPYRVYRPVYL